MILKRKVYDVYPTKEHDYLALKFEFKRFKINEIKELKIE